jgi:hypothetical protein
MQKIELSIPNYFPEDGLKSTWETGFKINCSISNGTMIISANQQGLLSLAKNLLVLAQTNVPSGSHYHFDEYNSLEKDAVELIIEKINA